MEPGTPDGSFLALSEMVVIDRVRALVDSLAAPWGEPVASAMTPREVRELGARSDPLPGLAARLAAKRAVLSLLGHRARSVALGIEPSDIEPRGIEPRGIESSGIEPSGIEPGDEVAAAGHGRQRHGGSAQIEWPDGVAELLGGIEILGSPGTAPTLTVSDSVLAGADHRAGRLEGPARSRWPGWTEGRDGSGGSRPDWLVSLSHDGGLAAGLVALRWSRDR